MKRLLFPLAAALLAVLPAPAGAHFNMLLPDRAAVKKGEAVTLTYQWGHPFEHQLFDAPAPESLVALAPDGKTAADLTKKLEKVTVPANQKKVTAYRVSFAPDQRGDYVFVLQTPPIWMAEEEEFFHDTVKVVLHVEAEKGWDATAPNSFQLVPLTRPYGLRAGMAFQAQVAGTDRPLAGAHVEVERYNPAPPKELPPDEQITRTLKTDPNGVLTGTLTEPGWWSVTARRDGGTREHEGKKYPVRRRATLWVFVDEKAAPAGP
jgi:cobalt/nickel transport protein